MFDEQGWIMRGGSIVDATIIAAPSSTKNTTGERDPQMHQTKKGNQWYFGMKAHIGVDAGTGYIHSVTATAANIHDLDEVTNLVRGDDEVVYADGGYQGVDKRPDVLADEHLSGVQFRVAARKSKLAAMPAPDRVEQARQAGVRAKAEHPFLIVKRDFGFTKTRYRGMAKNLNHLQMLFASANWLMRARAALPWPEPGRTTRKAPARGRKPWVTGITPTRTLAPTEHPMISDSLAVTVERVLHGRLAQVRHQGNGYKPLSTKR